MLKTIYYPDPLNWAELCKRPQLDTTNLDTMIAGIFEQVKQKGDIALKEFTLKYEKREVENFLVDKDQLESAGRNLSTELKKAIEIAAENILKFHTIENLQDPVIETMSGVFCWKRKIPIERVGIYIPGGTAPLFSTVLMLALPAKLAGCSEVILCTPAEKNGKVNEAVLFTAKLAGVKTIYSVGGAQAVAAMAIGTETIPKVQKIFGPGNQYVTAAKQFAARSYCAIDLPAGPSEVLVIADESADPGFVAADLLSQAEHGTDSQVILISTSEILVKEVKKSLVQQLFTLPRKTIAQEALQNSHVILLKSLEDAMRFSNLYCPEHLIIATQNADDLSKKVINAGSVFVGHYSPESAGDYASGTNHTLPTSGFAASYSAVSNESFLKIISFQKLTPDGLLGIGKTIELMAEAEKLEAHKEAVSIRMKKLSSKNYGL
ncbi:MAG: histidinol dehydrogenase [Bacteroidetes bacterium HGW-Bacteroidetes-1]|jgi:histidinol dehydrogenase|nr:MAG: histidinol dehydrogenase [Bacteroidetes bacterium HGW-Bacteroidetes-1]